MMSTVSQNRSRNRAYLVFIIALFVLPVVIAWLLIDIWSPSGRVHHGELLDPVRPVPMLRVRQTDGSELDNAFIKQRWTLAYIGATPDCDDVCQTSLYNMRQLRLGLGKDIDRMQTLLMMTETPDRVLRDWLEREHKAMHRGIADAQTVAFFRQAFETGTELGKWIYLIDPLGNLVMRYGPEVDPGGIRKDIKRLFKYSRIG